ncbi:MAG TPA: L-threonylcarbamoyladenylate synthase [Bacillota bacterium]|jgi:L-threonylcarbamoyladenylate synthase
MNTRLVRIHPGDLDTEAGRRAISEAAAVIRAGGLVAFPTETVYGLGANGLDEDAVARIFVAKGRPQDNPLILHVAEPAAVRPLLAEVPRQAERLMARFWPGPLTLVLPRSPLVPDVVTGGLETVAVRLPDHPVARALISAAGVPIAAPSANLSGRPSPTAVEHVQTDLGGRVEMIIDGGPTDVGVESTVLDVTAEPPFILRPGGVTKEQLLAFLGEVGGPESPGSTSAGRPRAPGMKYTHYSPRAPLTLFLGPSDLVVPTIVDRVAEERANGRRVGVLTVDEHSAALAEASGTGVVMASLGSQLDGVAAAENLFRRLRSFDAEGVDVILAEGVDEGGLGLAVMNRLRKAAERIVRVGRRD